MKTIILFYLTLLFVSACGPQYVQNPNANVIVISQYEDESPKIVLSPNSDCNLKTICDTKTGANCAAFLYRQSESFIQEGKKLITKKLYLSAQLEYMQALSHLSIGEIVLKKSKTESYEDWEIAVTLGLEKKIKERIELCEKQIRLLRWK